MTSKSIFLAEPTLAAVFGGIHEAAGWLAQYVGEPDWDGGAINVSFAGHGRPVDGALVVRDGEVDPASLLRALIDVREVSVTWP